jgi:putative ABC transport system substrate-binding protein
MKPGTSREATGTSKKVKVFGSALCTLLLAFSVPLDAQQSKVPRIGATFNTPGGLVEAFRQGLRDLGYVDGQNLMVEYGFIERRERPDPDPRQRTPAAQGRCFGRHVSADDPRRQTSD